MKLSEKQTEYVAGLRAMADYLEQHQPLVPTHKPSSMLMPWTVEEMVRLLKEQGEPLEQSSGYVTCDHGNFDIKVYIPSAARVVVPNSEFVLPVQKVLDDAAKATAERVAAEQVPA
jgi:hypothetical protein